MAITRPTYAEASAPRAELGRPLGRLGSSWARRKRGTQCAFALTAACILGACGGAGEGNSSAAAPSAAGQLSQAASLGEKIFHDASLSASGAQACASCHDPASAHAQANGLAVQLGGANPEEWYPLGSDGTVQKFNDLPAAYRRNVNTREAPYNRRPGMLPALSAADIGDVIRFLGTLNDGYGTNQ